MIRSVFKRPWLRSLRKRQRTLWFYTRMALDGRRYAKSQPRTRLPYPLYQFRYPLYNRDTGFDMVYQENKVFNLKLAAVTLDRLVIRPGETFSFWQRVRYADRDTPYREGLAVIGGELQTVRGGGMCQMSNLLFWLFLHTPLTIVERHGHQLREFPDPSADLPLGVDATVSEGLLDLKVRNDTPCAYQLAIWFDQTHICGQIASDRPAPPVRVVNGVVRYLREGDQVIEEAQVIQQAADGPKGQALPASRLLYCNRCRIGYPLPEASLHS